MKELLFQSYLIALPIFLTAIMGYIIWLLQEQKKQKIADTKERNDRIAKEAEERLANSKGTMSCYGSN